jgi:hypothetical protein
LRIREIRLAICVPNLPEAAIWLRKRLNYQRVKSWLRLWDLQFSAYQNPRVKKNPTASGGRLQALCHSHTLRALLRL